MLSVDLNCDMGESFGPWQMGNDAEVMRYISSVNIACGFHAGDASTIVRTLELAIENKLAIGAHPGYPDLQGFGRRNMSLSPAEVHDIVLYQVSALQGMCKAYGTRLNHVKPHGALYNQAAIDKKLSRSIADAVRRLDPSLVLYGLSGSYLISEAAAAGLRTASEAFADRSYQSNGMLTPRSEPNSIIDDPEIAAARAVQIVTDGKVDSDDGSVSITADTICVHGDGPRARDFVIAISAAFRDHGIAVRSV
ncbi:MAG: LamB/YcsF family protein [Pyrinomonadaceae bacterium]